MMFWNHGDVSVWGSVLMSVSMLLFWALVIAGIVALVRFAGRTHSSPQPGHRPEPRAPTPHEILAERFAKGEIDEEEYRRRRDTLGKPSP